MTYAPSLPLGDALRLVVEQEPDPQYGPADEKLRDFLEAAVYVRLLAPIPDGQDAASMIGAMQSADAARLGRSGKVDFEMVATSVLRRGMDPGGCAIFGFRWRLVPRAAGDPTLSVEAAASRERKGRWFAT